MLIGLLGKPSVGKSTFFKAATLAEVEIASYPFTTIKANHGVGYVKVECVDKEFNVKCNPKHGFCLNNFRFVAFDLMDVAGLVPGASEGKGLGNKFLDELRQADVFVHIVDVSGTLNEEGKPVGDTKKSKIFGATKSKAAVPTHDDSGQDFVGYDVCKDVEFLDDELDKWYCNILKKAWRTFSRKAEMEDVKFSDAVAKQFSGLKVDEYHVKDVLKKLGFKERASGWTDEQIMKFAKELRKISKPMIIAANKVDTEKSKENYEKLVKEFPDLIVIPCSADSELALREAAKSGLIEYVPGDRDFKVVGKLNEKQERALEKIKTDVLDEFVDGTGVQAVLNKAVFELLKYIAVFPVESANKLTDSKGNVLPDCFLIPQGSSALNFAYILHTDFGKNFIKAIDAKTKRVLGKESVLKMGDVLEIVTR